MEECGREEGEIERRRERPSGSGDRGGGVEKSGREERRGRKRGKREKLS